MDNGYTEITIPSISTPDQSQGLNNAPIEGSQIATGSNRNITDYKYWSFRMNCTSGVLTSMLSNTYYTFIYTGNNYDRNKTFSQVLFSGLGDVMGGSITKIYTTDTVNEKNEVFASQFPTRFIIKRGKIVRVSCRFETTTQSVSLPAIQGQYAMLFGTSDILSSTNTSIMFTSVSSNELLLNLVWASSTNSGGLVTERPRFSITIEIF